MELQQIVDKGRELARGPQVPKGKELPPELPGGLPVVGHTVEFARRAIDLLFRAHREMGEVAQFQAAHKKFVAMFGPEAHQAVFRAPDEQLSPSEAYKIMVPVFGKDIVYDAPPAKMNEQLKMLLPALKDRRMRTYGEIILEEVHKAMDGWGDEGEIDLVDFCRVLTNFTSSHCLVGREFREGMSEEFARVYHDLERGVTPIAYINPYLRLPSFRKRDKARVRLNEMISEIVEERKRENRIGEDFLQTLMDARYKSGAPLTDHEITGMLLAAMFAGHHTSSVTTAWALIELLRNPDELEAVKGEIAGVYGDDGVIDYQSLRRVVRTEWVVKETLRLHPPLFVLMRAVMKPFEYKGYHIPVGHMIAVSPTVAHRMPEHFHDPDKFDPARFGPGREEDKKPFAFIAFGGGRHKCMGNAFAILQVKAILASLLRGYEFELEDPQVESDFQGLVVGPKEPVKVRYRKRRQPLTAVVAKDLQKTVELPTEDVAPIDRIEVDRDLCQGHAVCIEEAPQVFKIDDKQKVVVMETTPEEQYWARVHTAAKYCPTGAIKVVTRDGKSADAPAE
ncbi:MAG: cytochrome P450 [Polyangiales bacterium]